MIFHIHHLVHTVENQVIICSLRNLKNLRRDVEKLTNFTLIQTLPKTLEVFSLHTNSKAFDIRFRYAIIDTVEHLMKSGVRFVYGYTQSDEISYYTAHEVAGYNPVTQAEVVSVRNRIKVELDLERGETYGDWVVSLLEE